MESSTTLPLVEINHAGTVTVDIAAHAMCTGGGSITEFAPAENRPAATDRVSPRGIDTPTIAGLFDSCGWSAAGWRTALKNPPQWLEHALVMRGRKGKGGAARWDPVKLATGLRTEKKVPLTAIDKIFRSPPLADWMSEWENARSYLDAPA
ncbi:hypothetical protein B0G83_108300 [Paraburkholderia sp. BL21I4N1]|nr:hypothetical protein B0G83_108300 [Paraburkholderia sp. BL21I4N1]